MDDPLRVGSIQRVGNLDAQAEQQLRIQRPAADAMLERLALQEFHGDKCAAALFTDVVNRADIRMVESRGSFRLAPESLQ